MILLLETLFRIKQVTLLFNSKKKLLFDKPTARSLETSSKIGGSLVSHYGGEGMISKKEKQFLRRALAWNNRNKNVYLHGAQGLKLAKALFEKSFGDLICLKYF